MDLPTALSQLEALGTDKMREQNRRHGATTDQYGVRLGDIRTIAKSIRGNHALALELWATGNLDARLLAILLMKPKQLTPEALDALVRSVSFTQVADWLNAYVVKRHPHKEALRQAWMTTDHPMAARAGWSLTHERVIQQPEGLDPDALLDRIQAEMHQAPPEAQWTMNFVLAEIGIRSAEHRQRAITIGEALGMYRDYPVSKGCTSPFAPIWIQAMVARQA